MHTTSSFGYGGHELVYDVYGSGDQLLVYLHGLLLDADLNRGIAEAMAGRGHQVVLLDLLGHGRSDRPTHASAYRIDSYAEQVFALLDELDVHEAVLGGLSLGANVSLFAASQRPQRVRGLVLEMPVLEWAVPAAALSFVPMLLAARYGRPLLRRTASLLAKVPPIPFGPLNSVVRAGATPPEVMAAVLHGVLVGPVGPTQEQRAGIRCPTLVLAHGNDLIHPFSDATNLAAQIPGARLERARSPLELRLRPRRLTDVIGDFLVDAWAAEHPRAAAPAAVAGA